MRSPRSFATASCERASVQTWLITGITGLLGSNAALDLADSVNVIGIARHVPEAAPVDVIAVDLADEDARRGLIDAHRPDVVLHCAANASHESCEADPAAAIELNLTASADLARQSAEAGAKFVFISTDAVFDGERGGYTEDEPTTPTTVYGRTKADAERAVLDVSPDALVARVNFYGWSPTGTRSLAEFFVNRLDDRSTAPGFTDVRVSTMYVETLVDRLRRLVADGAAGIFHVANDEPTSKFDFGRRIALRRHMGDDAIVPARAADVLAVPRGSDLSLDTRKLRDRLGLLSSQAEDLRSLFAAEAGGRRDALRAFLPRER